jgi:catechol 2,3-dioxygenase-like lactoylglutathione lyase family enzyme
MLLAMTKLTYACVLTRSVERLEAFYRAVLQIEPSAPRDTYREFNTPPGIFSLWSLDEFLDIATAAANGPVQSGSVMLEFQVDDVDREYERLQSLGVDFVLAPPTTLAWGNRSIYFRDPDGNLINFFTPKGAR